MCSDVNNENVLFPFSGSTLEDILAAVRDQPDSVADEDEEDDSDTSGEEEKDQVLPQAFKNEPDLSTPRQCMSTRGRLYCSVFQPGFRGLFNEFLESAMSSTILNIKVPPKNY